MIERRRKTMKSLRLVLAAAAAATCHPSLAEATPECSCSPTQYSIRLNFAGTCDDVVGLEAGGPGLEGAVCRFTKGSDPNDVADGDVEFGSATRALRRRRRGEGGRQWERVLGGLDFSAAIAHAEEIARQRPRHRRMQTFDITPTIVTSTTFIEADTSPEFNIINQDSSYFNVSSSDGDVLVYSSISAELNTSLPLENQMGLVPGGVTLITFGVNAANEVIQNMVAWRYSNACDAEPLAAGDGVGLTTVDDFLPPKGIFCDAVTDSPTFAPTTTPTTTPTMTPTKNPTKNPTKTPTRSPVTDTPTTASPTEPPVDVMTDAPKTTTVATAAPPATTPHSGWGGGSKSVFSKSAKMAKDAKAKKMGSKSKTYKMSMEYSNKSTKASKMFNASEMSEYSKSSKTKSTKSEKGYYEPSKSSKSKSSKSTVKAKAHKADQMHGHEDNPINTLPGYVEILQGAK